MMCVQVSTKEKPALRPRPLMNNMKTAGSVLLLLSLAPDTSVAATGLFSLAPADVTEFDTREPLWFTAVAPPAPAVNSRRRSSAGAVIADLNQDGLPDIFVPTMYGNNELLLGDGTGNFVHHTSGAAVNLGPYWSSHDYHKWPSAAAIEDINQDGLLDIFVANKNNGGTSPNELLLGAGGGNFTAVTSGAAVERNDSNSHGAAIADFNQDGLLDIFVANQGNNELLLGDGTGNFTAVTSGAAVEQKHKSNGVAIGDVNQDGLLDIFVINGGARNELLLGTGGGNFTAVTSGAAVERTDESRGVAIGDVNQDGLLDIFVTNENQYNELLLGDGSGNFTAVTSGAAVEREDRSYAATMADVNQDGLLDIFVVNGGQHNEFLLGNGNGDFTAVTSGVVVDRADWSYGPAAIADVNRDGLPDIFVSVQNTYGDNNELLLSDGTINVNNSIVAITSGAVVEKQRTSRRVAIADVNLDGLLDIFVANAEENELLLGNGAGNFTAVTVGAAVDSNGVAIGDVNRDGLPDIFVCNTRRNELLLGDGTGNFTAVTSGAAVELQRQSQAATIADVNGDELPDILVVSWRDHNELLLGDGTGGFTAVTSGVVVEQQYDSLSAPAIADFNQDGVSDIFVANDGPNELLLGTGGGNFTAVTSGAAVTNTNSWGAAIADFNQDGLLDIFVANHGNNELLLGDGTGNFTAVTSGAAVEQKHKSYGVAIGDVNQDGLLDIFVINHLKRNELLLGDGMGNFTAVTSGAFTGRAEPSRAVAIGDVNQDGLLDIFVANTYKTHNELLLVAQCPKLGSVPKENRWQLRPNSSCPRMGRLGVFPSIETAKKFCSATHRCRAISSASCSQTNGPWYACISGPTRWPPTMNGSCVLERHRVAGCYTCPAYHSTGPRNTAAVNMCEFCPAGKLVHGNEVGIGGTMHSIVCGSCVPGRFRAKRDRIMSAECTICPAGRYAEGGAAECANCSNDLVTNIPGEGASGCQTCNPGQQPSSEGIVCQNCPNATFSKFGVECTLCPNAYHPTDARDACESCPYATFQRRSHYATVDQCPGTVYSAAMPCTDNYTGTLCQACAKGYRKTHIDLCELCSDTSNNETIILLLVLAVFTIGGLAAHTKQRKNVAPPAIDSDTLMTVHEQYENPADVVPELVTRDMGESISIDHSETTSIEQSWLYRLKRLSTADLYVAMRCAWQPTRIVIGYFQVTSQLGTVLHITYPSAFASIMHDMKSLLDVFGLVFSPECIGLASFHSTWVLRVFCLPMSMLVIATGYVLLKRHRARDGNGACYADACTKTKRAELVRNLKSPCFFIVFFCYPSICNICFSALNCEPLSDENLSNLSDIPLRWARSELVTRFVLLADDRIFCDELGSIQNLSILVIVGFGCGIPIGFGWLLLHSARSHRLSDEDTRDKTHINNLAAKFSTSAIVAGHMVRDLRMEADYGFLMDAYKPTFLYWETMELLRKLVLVGFMVLVRAGTIWQLTLAALLCVLFLCLQVRYRPYKIEADNTLRMVVEVQIFVTILAAFIQLNSDSSSLLSGLLVGSFVVCVPLAWLLTIVTKLKQASLSGVDANAAFARFQLGLASGADIEQLAQECRQMKVVVMSTSEMGTIDPDGGPPYDQEVMTKVVEMQKRGLVKLGFDRAGSSNTDERDSDTWPKIIFEEAKKDLFEPDLEKRKKLVKQTYWFAGYKAAVKAQLKLECQNFDGTVVVVCLHGGTITKVEHEAMDEIVKDAEKDAKLSEIQCDIQLEKISFFAFLQKYDRPEDNRNTVRKSATIEDDDTGTSHANPSEHT